MRVTPIWAVARKRSMLSWRCLTRRAAPLPSAMSCSTRPRRMEMMAISLPEKKPFPSRHSTMATTSTTGVVTPRPPSSWMAADHIRSSASAPSLSRHEVFDSVALRTPDGSTTGGTCVSNGEFDVTVIGSGPGGYVAAIRAAQMGLRTACVERDPTGLGGTCLLRGCIPTKALLHTADLYEEIKHGKEYGIVADGLTLDFAAVMSRKSRIVNRLSKGIESYLFKKNKITLFKGQARLEGAGNVVVKGEGGETRVKTKNVILATGSRPRTLPGLAIDGKTIVSSDEILQIAAVPRSLVVIGAGSVGMEFAWLFARFGSAVTVIELLPRVLPLEDEEISTEAGKLPAKSRTIHTGAKTEGALKTAQGVEVAFRAADGQARSVTAEVLLVAVGRGPVTDGLGLESTKVQLDRGNIRVDA